MKKALYLLILCVLIGTGCRRTSHNGDIDGFWRVVSVEQIANGTTILKDTVIYPEDLFYCINLELMQLQPLSYDYTGVMNYSERDRRLTVEFPKQAEGPTGWQMQKFGIWTNPVTFEVNAGRSHLVLRTPESVIKCDRF